jgi:phage gpG-like protein|tara:strand:+ start:878 stop:1345 length:468 start_codon:yes stop_codon:yes gene_type:complete
MQTKISVSKVDIKRIKKSLATIKPTKTVHTKFANDLQGKIRRFFQAGGQAPLGGNSWKDLSPVTQRIRVSQGFTANDILVRTGKLSQAFTNNVSVNKIEISNPTPYGPDAEGPTSFAPQGRPIMPSVDENTRVRDQIVNIYMKYYKQRLFRGAQK